MLIIDSCKNDILYNRRVTRRKLSKVSSTELWKDATSGFGTDYWEFPTFHEVLGIGKIGSQRGCRSIKVTKGS